VLLESFSPQKVKKRLRIAFAGSCLPRKCGIATFSATLSQDLEDLLGRGAASFVALNNGQDYDYSPAVICQIEQENREDYRRAAEVINASAADVVSLQHEFGLFGGPDGNYIVDFLSGLQKPVVTTLHTVLAQPSPGQYKAFVEVAAFSKALVVMNKTAMAIMTDKYDLPREKIYLIPHGVPDLFFIDPIFYKHKMNLSAHFVILTFGFLSPNKGLEVVLQALPAVVEKHPETLYIVLGITHPVVHKNRGEEYRESLIELTKRSGLADHVLFVNEFVDEAVLNSYLGAADLVVCPYHSEAQISSGVLSSAQGMGKAIIATPFLHAREALAGERGLLVNFNDPPGLSKAVLRLLEDEPKRKTMEGLTYALGRQMVWGRVADQYLEVFEKQAARAVKGERGQRRLDTLPPINLHYLRMLTDETGVVQHTNYGIPDYAHYYSADDAARALVAYAHYFNLFMDESVLPLVDRCLAFLIHARQEGGWFYNYMNYRKEFPIQELSQDTFGRCLWGLGSMALLIRNCDQRQLAGDLLEAGLAQLSRLSYTRPQAYSALGLAAHLTQHPTAEAVKTGLRLIADQLLNSYRANSAPSWQWFEKFLTYDNARLPQALLLAYTHLAEPAYLDVALNSLDFLIRVQYHDGYFDLIGNQGWYVQGEEKALFCQQPLDAGALTESCLLAWEISGQQKYIEMAYAAFQWYLGRNRLNKALYNPLTGACADGLAPEGPSKNKGAEPIISFLLAQLALYRWELIGRFS
jgi:glycosyltransferase involved in cell wall biosynthesis